MEDMIKISDIRPDNPIVVEAITSQGYAIVKHSYLEQCNRESAELARIKFDLKLGFAKNCAKYSPKMKKIDIVEE